MPNSLQNLSLRAKKFIFAICVAITLGIIYLIYISFSNVKYDQYGFVKTKSTGKVDTSKVYTAGRYMLGPDKTFKVFSAVAHLEDFENLSVFTADKLELVIDVHLQYFLRKDDLKLLHDEYDLQYKSTLRNTVRAAIKNRAATFKLDEYLRKREYVENELHVAAQLSLGGPCCSPICTNMTCPHGCIPYTTCDRNVKGLFADVRLFQLGAVYLASSIASRKLEAVIIAEREQTEKYKQDEKVERKKTEQLRKLIINQANEVFQNATAKANLLKAKATVEAKALTDNARNSGLEIICRTLNITNETHKNSLDYIRTLINHRNTNLYVNFQTMIGKS